MQKKRNIKWLKTFMNPDPSKYRFGLCDYTNNGCIENKNGRFLFIEFIDNAEIEE